MEIGSLRTPQIGANPFSSALDGAKSAQSLQAAGQDEKDVRKAFDSFVGEAFFGQLLSSMRKTQGKPAYFHGGRAEEIFQGQLDQTLAETMTEHSAADFTGPMYELFQLNRA